MLGENGGYCQYDGTLTGYDSIGSLIICTSANANLFTVNSRDCMFRNMTFVNHAPSTPTAGTGIYLAHAGGFKMQDCTIMGFWDDMEIVYGEYWAITGTNFVEPVNWGLKIGTPLLPDIGDNTIAGCVFLAGAHTTANIRYESSSGLKIANCKFNGTTGHWTPTHIDAQIKGNSGILEIVNSSLEAFTNYGIHVHPSPGIVTGAIIINGCQMAAYDAPTGNFISLHGLVNQVVIGNNIFSDNYSYSNTHPVIYADSVNTIVIRSNSFWQVNKKMTLLQCTNVDTTGNDSTWTDNGLGSKKQTSNRDTVEIKDLKLVRDLSLQTPTTNGDSGTGRFRITSDALAVLGVNNNGGLTSPGITSRFEIQTGNGNHSDMAVKVSSTNTDYAPCYWLAKSRGTLNTPSDVIAGERIGAIVAAPYRNNTFRTGAKWEWIVSNTPYGDTVPLDMVYSNHGGNQWSDGGIERFRIKDNGSVGIGTDNAVQKLEVNGKVRIDDVPVSGTIPSYGITIDENNTLNKYPWPAGNDTLIAVKGKSVFLDADSSFYDCRSTTSAHKWWKRKYD